MRILGIVGGIAPSSTIEYYEQLVFAHRSRRGDDSYPHIVLNSINLREMVAHYEAGDLDGVVELFVRELERLARAGAEVGFFASNTPHRVFDRVQPRSPFPLVSIVEAARARVARLGYQRVGLLGTRFTMEGDFYQRAFAASGISVVAPDQADLAAVHELYMRELIHGEFLPESRARVEAAIDALRRDHAVSAVLLAGTELPLLLQGAETAGGIPVLDTTRIHVAAIADVWLA